VNYRVDRDLLLATQEMLAPYVRNCTSIFTALADILKLVLSPLPMYISD
jgi:hypothetical protein